MKRLMIWPQLLLLAVAASLVLVGCDSASNDSNTTACESRTGNSMAAKVNGQALCTDLGNALVSEASGKRLSVVGFFTDGSASGASITLNVNAPEVGTQPLTDGQYSTEDESVYYVVNAEAGEGTGTVTITELSDTRVAGTFALTAIGIDAATDAANGNQVEVTDGTFDFALGTLGYNSLSR